MLNAAVLVLAALVGEGGAAAAPAPESLKLQAGPMARVLEEAKASGRPVLVDFYTDWCGWCKRMDKEVFGDAEVAKYCNENFLVFRVDAEKGEGPDLAKKHGVGGYPTFVVLDAAGEELDAQPGYAAREPFTKFLKDVKAGNHLKGLREGVAKAPEDPVLRAKLGKKLMQKEDPDARDHLEKAVALDAKDAHAETVEARYFLSLLDARRDQSPDPIAAFAKKYADSPSAVDAHRILLRIAQQGQDGDAERTSLEFLVKRSPDAETRNNLAWVLATGGQELDRALALVDAALKDEPKSAAYLDTRAECLSRLGRHDEAVETQKKAVASLPADMPAEERAGYEGRLEEFQKKRDAAAAEKK
jgi:thioredoxin-related protein